MMHRFLNWVRAFLELFDALIMIATFTLVRPDFGFRFFIWQVKQGLNRRRNER